MKVTFVELLQTAILLLPSDQVHTIRLSTPLNTTRQRQITPREILSRLLGVVNDNNLFLSNPIRVHLSKFYAIFCRALSVSSPSSRAFTLLEERWRHQAEQVGHFPVSSVHYCLGWISQSRRLSEGSGRLFSPLVEFGLWVASLETSI